MRTMTASALALAVSLGLGSAAMANEGYKDKDKDKQASNTTMQQDSSRGMAASNQQTALEARVGQAEADRLSVEFRQLDRDSDGVVMVSELDASQRTELARFDADGDNKLDRYEFEMAHSASFADLDDDSDGKLSRAEVDVIRPEWVSFVALDTDNDQALSQQEYRKFIESGDWVDDKERYAFEYVDIDGDGLVNEVEAEVFVPLSSQFTAVDTDGDGTVDRTQYEVLLSEIELERQARVQQ